MKKIFRVIVFTAMAVFLTSMWNKGFSFSNDPAGFAKTVALTALVFYLVLPLSKVVLFPLNLITLGAASFIVSALMLYILEHFFHIISVSAWKFPGIHIGFIKLKAVEITRMPNFLLSSVSISGIITILEKLI